jgi:hypothetical protein
MLPFFFRHYDELVDEYFVYDNGSTDASLMMLRDHGRVHIEHFDVHGDSFVDEERRLGDTIWQRSRGKADWVIVTDIDEHIYRPDLIAYLERCSAQGITAIKTVGYDMVADHFPAGNAKLVDQVSHGCRSAGLDRLCIFNPDAITATHYGPGRHKAWPEGHVVWPLSSEVLLLHFKQMGVDYVCERSAELARGIKTGDIDKGWGKHYQWNREAIVENWQRMKDESIPVPGLGELKHITPENYRGDEKIVEDSGLLDVDWYLAKYEDLEENRVEPLTHFCRYGWREGRLPNFYFDPEWYSSTYPHATENDRNPLVHYILQGERDGDWPSPHFDTGWYREQHGLEPDESPLRHYLLRRASGLVTPMPDFDVDAYCNSYPEVIAEGLDPYEHFINEREGRGVRKPAPTPYPAFDTVAKALGVDARSKVIPAQVSWRAVTQMLQLYLAHYPVDEDWYRREYPDVDLAIRSGKMPSARAHFVQHGFFEGREFGPPPDAPGAGDAAAEQQEAGADEFF